MAAPCVETFTGNHQMWLQKAYTERTVINATTSAIANPMSEFLLKLPGFRYRGVKQVAQSSCFSNSAVFPRDKPPSRRGLGSFLKGESLRYSLPSSCRAMLYHRFARHVNLSPAHVGRLGDS